MKRSNGSPTPSPDRLAVQGGAGDAGVWASQRARRGLWAAGRGARAQPHLSRAASDNQLGFFERIAARNGARGAELLSFADALSGVYRVSMPLGDREESEGAFEENVWVRAALKAFSEAFNRLDFRIFEGDPKDQDAVEIDEHPILELLDAPNPLQTGREFWVAHVIDRKIDGEQIWFLADANGDPVATNPNTNTITAMPAQVVPVRGKLVEIKRRRNGMPESYRYTTSSKSGGSTSNEFPPAAVVHFREYNPSDPVRGLGDVDSLERETSLYFQAFRSMDGSVRSGGDPGGFIIFEHNIAPGEMERLQAQFDESIAGPEASRYKLLEAKAKFVANPTKPSDMQYPTLLEWLRDSILAGLGVPPAIVGIYEDATLANVETAYREFYTGPNGVLGFASGTADVVTHRLIRRLDVPGIPRIGGPRARRPVAYFDASSVEALQEDIGEKIDRAADTAAKGIGVSFNETLEMQGVQVDPAQEGDRKWIAAGLTDLDDPEAGKPPTPEPAPEPAEEVDEDDEETEGGDDGEGDADGDASETQSLDRDLAAALPSAFRVELVGGDPKLAQRVEKWIAAFEREQIARLRKLSNRGLRRFSALDEPFDPSGLSDAQWDALLLESVVWAKRLERDVRVALREVFAAAAAQAHGEVGGSIVTTTDPDVIQVLASQRIKLAEGVTSTTTKRVRNAIARVLSGARNGAELREAVKEVLPELTEELRRVFGSKDARAAAISQTETGRAENGAHVMQYERSGVEEVKWIASEDEATRESHSAVNGQTIKLGERFANGLRYPHDPEAPAAEVVNCRCVVRAAKRVNPLDALEAQ